MESAYHRRADGAGWLRATRAPVVKLADTPEADLVAEVARLRLCVRMDERLEDAT